MEEDDPDVRTILERVTELLSTVQTEFLEAAAATSSAAAGSGRAAAAAWAGLDADARERIIRLSKVEVRSRTLHALKAILGLLMPFHTGRQPKLPSIWHDYRKESSRLLWRAQLMPNWMHSS